MVAACQRQYSMMYRCCELKPRCCNLEYAEAGFVNEIASVELALTAARIARGACEDILKRGRVYAAA